MTIARGMLRRGSTISSPMNEPASSPVKANAMVDQKTISLRPVAAGARMRVIGVAEPYSHAGNDAHDDEQQHGTPGADGSRRLASHLPTSRPTMFIPAAMRQADDATTMK